MAHWLDRFDEVWAEINNLPSPYYLRKQEIDRLAVEQIAEKIKEDMARMCKYNICRPVQYIEMSYVNSPADRAIATPVPSGGVNVQQ
jgi:hypothetical protein